MSPVITARPVVIVSPDDEPFAYVDIALGAVYPPADLKSLMSTDRSMQASYLGKHSPDPQRPVWRIPASARDYAARSIESLGYPVERRTTPLEPTATVHALGWECPNCTQFRKRTPTGKWGRCPWCGENVEAIPAGSATDPPDATESEPAALASEAAP